MKNEKEQMIFYLINKYKELIQLEMDYQEWKKTRIKVDGITKVKDQQKLN